jgi:hypothetical protein
MRENMEETTTVIKSVALPDGTFDLDVQTGLSSHDELTVVLLLLVEKMTGVSTDDYVAEVDRIRSALIR